MELKFVAAKKPVAVNVTVQRRQRLVRRIDQQISHIQSSKDGFLPRTSWVWMNDSGAYFLPIKYGRNPIELKKGMFAIQCENMAAAIQALLHIRVQALNGELDNQLAAASGAIRAKFQKA